MKWGIISVRGQSSIILYRVDCRQELHLARKVVLDTGTFGELDLVEEVVDAVAEHQHSGQVDEETGHCNGTKTFVGGRASVGSRILLGHCEGMYLNCSRGALN